MKKGTLMGKIVSFIQPNENVKLYQEKLIRLLDDEHIKEKLEVTANSNLIDFFNEPKFKEFKRIFAKMKQNLLPKGMNPHEPYPAVDYFFENEVINQIFEWIKSTAKDIYESDELDRKVLLLIGNKGSGKTLTQNIILYTNKDWFQNNRVFWVRCDMQKLFNLWNQNNTGHQVSVDQYLNVQLLYVFCKYYRKNDFFTDVMKILKDKKPQLYSFVIQETDIIENYERARKNRNSNTSYAIDEILANSSVSRRQKAFNKWEQNSIELQEFIITEFKGKVLFILDGVDNIDLSFIPSLKLYNKMLEETRIFLKNDIKKNYLYFASMRPRTRIELRSINRFPDYNNNFRLPDEILELELDFTKQTQITPSNQNFLANVIELRFKDCINLGGSDEIQEIINKILNTIIKKESNTQINSMFHSNCRNYLFNKYNTILFIVYRWIRDGEYPDYNFDDAYDKLSNQSLLLNGKLFYSSLGLGTVNSDTGYFMYNIFFFDSKILSNNIWPGLCGLRIMQFLEYKYKDIITQEIIVDYFKIFFKYPETLVIKHLNYLREYGMIDSELDAINSRQITLLNTSRKGTFILSMITNNLEWLYYFSLDTYFPINFIENHQISSHSLKKYNPANYHFHCIQNGLLFMKFIKQIEYNEIQQLKDTIAFKEFVYDSTFIINFNVEKIAEFIMENVNQLDYDQLRLINKKFKLTLRKK